MIYLAIFSNREYFAEQLWSAAPVQVVIMLLGCVAARAALATKHKHLASLALAAPLLALGMSMWALDHAYANILAMRGVHPELVIDVPADQLSSAIAHELEIGHLFVGLLVSLMLPVVTWIWARVHAPGPSSRLDRGLLVGASLVISVGLWGATDWIATYIYVSHCGPYWSYGDFEFAGLEQSRTRILVLGGVLVSAAIGLALVRARQGITPGPRLWAALLSLLALGLAARVWTAAERRDTVDYFRPDSGTHGYLGARQPVSDPQRGPRLDHCRDERNLDIVPVDDLIDSDIELFAGSLGRNPSDTLGAILAEPEVPIERIAIALRAIEADGRHHAAVVSIRPIPIARETTGEFMQLRTCIVELELGPRGVPLATFSTWAELAAAADAAEGGLVVDVAAR